MKIVTNLPIPVSKDAASAGRSAKEGTARSSRAVAGAAPAVGPDASSQVRPVHSAASAHEVAAVHEDSADQSIHQKNLEMLEKKADAASSEIAHIGGRIEVDRDEGTGRFVMRVLDKSSGDVIRQFPPETVLRVSERLNELSGMLIATEL